jgi:hypothetical protein
MSSLSDEVAIAFVRDPDGHLVELVGSPTSSAAPTQ